MKENVVKLGRAFVFLWFLTFFVQLISLQVRLAVFGGTGWLTYVKYVTFSERLGFISLIGLLCAAFVSLWVLIGDRIAKIFKIAEEKAYRWLSTIWVIMIAVDTVLRHKVADLLGSAFNFFDFATGVGGVWHMLEQAFSWYGDVILLGLLGVLALGVAVYWGFRWFLRSQSKLMLLFDRFPKNAIRVVCCVSCVSSFGFMSLFSSNFLQTRTLVAEETTYAHLLDRIIEWTTDFDGDGYGMFSQHSDLAPFDPSKNPYAIDIPDDGIDQDCLLGDLEVASISKSYREWVDGLAQGVVATPLHRKNVVIVVLESLRHDMPMAIIDNTPVMASWNAFLADGAISVPGMYATRGFTNTSINQLFSGSFFDTSTTLVDDFKQMGYSTAVYNGESLLDEGFDKSCGWERSGDVVVDPRTLDNPNSPRQTAPANDVMDDAEKYIKAHSNDVPMFLYMFFQDPHFPYQQDNPPFFIERMIKRSEIKRENRDGVWRAYANQVYFLDKALGRLITVLKQKGIYDDTLIIFVSDHGESLFDDGYLLGHGTAFMKSMTHCAMAVRGADHDIPRLLSHVDFRRWILEDLFIQKPSDANSLECHVETMDFQEAGAPKQKVKLVERPDYQVVQYLGPRAVPSGISFVKENGDRIVYNNTNSTAYREIQGVKTILASPHDDPEIRELIRTWEYIQYKQRFEVGDSKTKLVSESHNETSTN